MRNPLKERNEQKIRTAKFEIKNYGKREGLIYGSTNPVMIK
jgi:hypothetical protein